MAKQRQSKTANAVLVDELNKVDEVLEVGSNGLIACNDDMSATVDTNLGVLTYGLDENGTQVDEDGNELIFSVNPDGSETYYNGHTEVEIYGQTSDRDKIVVTDNSVLNSYDFGVLGSMEQLINFSERDIRQSFVHIGCALSVIARKCLYNSKGYADVYEYALNVFGYSTSSVKNLINIYDKFVDKTKLEVIPRFQEYSYSQLVEMSSLYNFEFVLVSPSFTVRQIREVKKFLKENGGSSLWNSSNIFDYIAKANSAYNNALLDKPKADKVVSEVSCSTGVADELRLPSEVSIRGNDVRDSASVGTVTLDINERDPNFGVFDLSSRDAFVKLYNQPHFFIHKFKINYTYTNGRKSVFDFSICIYSSSIKMSISYGLKDCFLYGLEELFFIKFNYLDNENIDNIYDRYKFYYSNVIRMVSNLFEDK